MREAERSKTSLIGWNKCPRLSAYWYPWLPINRATFPETKKKIPSNIKLGCHNHRYPELMCSFIRLWIGFNDWGKTSCHSLHVAKLLKFGFHAHPTVFWPMERLPFCLPSLIVKMLHLLVVSSLTLLCYCAWSWKLVYSQLPLRWTRSGPAPTVRLREVSTLEGDEVRQGPTPGVCFSEVSALMRCSLRGSWLYSSLSERRKLQDHSVRKSMCQMPRPHGPDDADWLTDYLLY